jgi:hypothetical protein
MLVHPARIDINLIPRHVFEKFFGEMPPHNPLGISSFTTKKQQCRLTRHWPHFWM